MASTQILASALRCLRIQSLTSNCRKVSGSAPCCAGRKWRTERGLPPRGNEYGPLTEIPDWSYADGRPTPIQKGELNRRQKNKQLTSSVVEMLADMKKAKKIHADKRKRNTQR